MGILDSLLSSAVGVVQQERQNAFNAREAEKNRVFNAEQAQLAFQRELSADSTKYQRATADMLAAGLNPMLAAGSGGGSVNSSPASGTPASAASVGNLSELFIQGEQLEIQKRLAEADIALKESQADKNNAETESTELGNEITRLTKDAVVEARKLDNELTRTKVSEGRKKLEEIDATISKLIAETQTEGERQTLIGAQRMLAEAQTSQVVALIPYQKALMSAQTEAQRQAAILSAAHAAYQNKLLNDGYIDAFIRREAAEATSAEVQATLDQIKEALRTGKGLDGIIASPEDGLLHKIGSHITQVLTVTLDNLNPLANLFK